MYPLNVYRVVHHSTMKKTIRLITISRNVVAYRIHQASDGLISETMRFLAPSAIN